MNGWGSNEPEEYKKCSAAGHRREETNDYFHCTHSVVCHECKLVWHYDSGD